MDQFVNIELESLNANNNVSTMDKLQIVTANATATASANASANAKPRFNSSLIETCISVSIHTFVMAVFEIYFYFDYIVVIEKKMFMDKIDEYTVQINTYYTEHISKEQHLLLVTMFPKSQMNLLLQALYEDYKHSLDKQHKLLHQLLLKSYKMLVVVTSILLFFFTIGICCKKKLHWKKIIVDNLLMFICLGVFEYIFFINIILHYSPVTDAEIKYEVVKNLIQPFIQNNTRFIT